MANPATGLTSEQFFSVQKFHAAEMLTDDLNGATYTEPVNLGTILRQVQIKPTTSSVTAYADGQAIDTAADTAKFELTIETAALPLEYIAWLLGHKYENGTMTTSKDDTPPYFAIMFQSDKRNNKARYMKFYKVQFQEPEQTNKTKEESLEFQYPSLTATAIYRKFDGKAYVYGDDEDANFDPTTFYTAVDLPSPNLSVSPVSLTLDSGNNFTSNVTVTRNGNGTITATSNHSDITVSVSGTTITITGTNSLTSAITGTVTVTVAADGTSYSGQSKTVNVTVAAA